MNEESTRPNNLIDTTDCLEAVGVFRGWKNFLFVIITLCLLLLQACFWYVNFGCVEADEATKKVTVLEPNQVSPTDKADEAMGSEAAVGQIEDANKTSEIARKQAKPVDEIEEAAKKITAQDSNQVEPMDKAAEPSETWTGFVFHLRSKQIAVSVRILNFVLILAAGLYCLTMLFSLKVSMLGRLGGINHITRAFFLSLAFLVLLLPWQRFFSSVVFGAIYTPKELFSSCSAVEGANIFCRILYYLRFSGYWVLVVLLLIFSQLRSSRWTKATLRRLEVM